MYIIILNMNIIIIILLLLLLLSKLDSIVNEHSNKRE